MTRFLALRELGFTNQQATRRLRTSRPTLWRWERRLKAGGLSALEPRTGRCGPPSLLKKLRVSRTVIQAVQRLACTLQSNTRAWHQFAASPMCPPKIAAAVRAHGPGTVPLSFHRATRLHRSKITLITCGKFSVYLPKGRSGAAAQPQRRGR